ncbi:36966_t:CDS:1, partial [Gigaspora margarita]
NLQNTLTTNPAPEPRIYTTTQFPTLGHRTCTEMGNHPNL